VDAYTIQGCYNIIDMHQRCPVRFLCKLKEADAFEANYIGTNTIAEKRALIWSSRASVILSFFGASYILYDILSDPKVRKNVYHQLLIGMAILDVITAIAWVFSTAPIDANEGHYVEGAIGTRAIGTAQAFFIQLGFTSVFYDVSLGLYYALVVAYGWKAFQLQKIRLYLHLFQLLLGLGLALCAIPSYHWFDYGCHILPSSDELWTVLVSVVLPLGASIGAITLSMFLVYGKVRSQAAKSRKWSLGVGKASKLEQAVFWQCFYYVLAFYISWPILFAVYLFSIDVTGPFGLALTVAFVAPLQGFNNFLVYIRPKLMKRTEERRARSRSRIQESLASVFRIFDLSTRRSSMWNVDPSVAMATKNNKDEHVLKKSEESSDDALMQSMRCINGLTAAPSIDRVTADVHAAPENEGMDDGKNEAKMPEVGDSGA
jgi:hypothetical protein